MSVKISELPVLAPADVAAGDVVAIVDASEGVTKQVDLSGVLAGGGSGDPFAAKAIAEPFAIWDHITGATAPDNSGTAKFIRLTAGQSGVGEYNEGLLTDEQVSGSAPLVEADAEIVTGPLAGQRVPLINTEMSFIRAGTDSGALQFDQTQKLVGEFRTDGTLNPLRNNPNLSGVFGSAPATEAIRPSGTADANTRALTFDSAGSPNARVSDTTEGETRVKNRQATFYMRIA